MANKPIIKTSWEKVDIDFDFTSKWPGSATTISSLTFSAMGYHKRQSDVKTDATSTVIDSTNGTIASAKVGQVIVKAGTDDYNYDIRCQAILDTGAQVEGIGLVKVRDN